MDPWWAAASIQIKNQESLESKNSFSTSFPFLFLRAQPSLFQLPFRPDSFVCLSVDVCFGFWALVLLTLGPKHLERSIRSIWSQFGESLRGHLESVINLRGMSHHEKRQLDKSGLNWFWRERRCTEVKNWMPTTVQEVEPAVWASLGEEGGSYKDERRKKREMREKRRCNSWICLCLEWGLNWELRVKVGGLATDPLMLLLLSLPLLFLLSLERTQERRRPFTCRHCKECQTHDVHNFLQPVRNMQLWSNSYLI